MALDNEPKTTNPKSPTSTSGSEQNETAGKDVDREKGGVLEFNDSNSKLYNEPEVKLDSYGIPLQPQPSRFKDDPLVRVTTFKRHDSRVLRLSHVVQPQLFLNPFPMCIRSNS